MVTKMHEEREETEKERHRLLLKEIEQMERVVQLEREANRGR